MPGAVGDLARQVLHGAVGKAGPWESWALSLLGPLFSGWLASQSAVRTRCEFADGRAATRETTVSLRPVV